MRRKQHPDDAGERRGQCGDDDEGIAPRLEVDHDHEIDQHDGTEQAEQQAGVGAVHGCGLADQGDDGALRLVLVVLGDDLLDVGRDRAEIAPLDRRVNLHHRRDVVLRDTASLWVRRICRRCRRDDLVFLETPGGNKESLVGKRIVQLQEELTKAQEARIEKESLYNLVQPGDNASLPGVFESKPIQDLTVQLADLERQLAKLTTMFTSDYPKTQELQNQINAIQAALSRERGHAAEQITNQYIAAMRLEQLARHELQQEQQRAYRDTKQFAEYDRLKREADTNQNLYDSLLQHLKEAGFSPELKASEIRVVDPAKPPQVPASPKVALNLSLAATLGLLLGVGLAFLTESMDKTFKSPEEMEGFLGSTLLASVPCISFPKRRNSPLPLYERDPLLGPARTNERPWTIRVFSHSSPRSNSESSKQATLYEAFSSLGTSLLLSAASHPLTSILITSAELGEGKNYCRHQPVEGFGRARPPCLARRYGSS